MCLATAAGTRSLIGCARASRARIIVDEMSRVRASTRMIRVFPSCGRSASQRGAGARATPVCAPPPPRGGCPGRAMTTKCAPSSTAGNSRHVEISANASAPRMKKICNGVQPSTVHRTQRVGRIGGPGSGQLQVRNAIRRTVLDGERDEREAVKGARHAGSRCGAADRGRQQADCIELQRRASGFGGVEVAEVNRIERAAENPDPASCRHASRRVRDGVIKSIPLEADRHGSALRRGAGARTGDLAPRRLQQLRESVACDARDGDHGQLACANVPRQTLQRVRIVERIDLVRPRRSGAWRRAADRRAAAPPGSCRSLRPDRVPMLPRHRPGAPAPWSARRGGGTDRRARDPRARP